MNSEVLAGALWRPLSLPLDPAELACLTAGDACLLSGPLFTLRDAGHQRLLSELDAARAQTPCRPNAEQVSFRPLPYGLSGQTILYAGPTPSAAGRPFGAIGPTTASRMDFAAPRLYRAGIVATIGKGRRAAEVARACVECGAVYFASVGGAAAYLAKCVESSEVVAYDDLGTEALRRIEVRDFPVFVGVDVHGSDVYARA